MARSILVIIWHLLADPEARFTDLGYGYHQARTDTDRKLRNHIRRSKPSASPSPSPRPNNPYRPLTRPDHRTGPGPLPRAHFRKVIFRSVKISFERKPRRHREARYRMSFGLPGETRLGLMLRRPADRPL